MNWTYQLKHTEQLDKLTNKTKLYAASRRHQYWPKWKGQTMLLQTNNSQKQAGTYMLWSFSGSSVGKESAHGSGGPGSIPGLGRSPGDRIGCPLQYSWAPLVAQMIKNLPAMRKTWVWSLGWEDPLEKGTETHSRILVCRIPMDRRTQRATVHRVAKSWTRLSNSAQHSTHRLISDKQSSRQKRVTIHKNGQNIIVIQGTIHQEDLTEINICT